MVSFRSNRSWYNNRPSNASKNLVRPSESKTTRRSNRSWYNEESTASNNLRPSESKTTRIGPFLYSDIYRVNNFPQFSSARNFIEAAIRSSIVRHKLENTSLINVVVLDSDGIGASLPWSMTVADEKNLYGINQDLTLLNPKLLTLSLNQAGQINVADRACLEDLNL